MQNLSACTPQMVPVRGGTILTAIKGEAFKGAIVQPVFIQKTVFGAADIPQGCTGTEDGHIKTQCNRG